MSITVELVEGVAEPVDMQLKNRAADSIVAEPQSFNATGWTIALELTGSDGAAVDTSGKVSWFDATVSKARFTRLANDLTREKSPYRARWIATEPGPASWPHPYPSTKEPDIWIVYEKT